MRPLRLVLAALALLVAAGCGAGDDEEGGAAGAASDVIEIAETDFALDPATVTLDQPGTHTFRAVNNGAVEHALFVEGAGVEAETELIAPGETAELTVEITEPGEYELYCPVANHRELGMEGSITLGGAAGGGTTDETTTEEQKDEDGGGYRY